MKHLIADICVSILRKLNYSVIIGYKVDGDLHALNNNSAIYDNELGGDYYLANGEAFDIPEGKFRYEREERQ